MPSPKVYFIGGASRGIGLALTTELAKNRPDVHVFAGVRNTSSQPLKDLAAEYPDKITIVSFFAADEASNKAAAKVVEEKFGRVDIVLYVAGMSDFMGPVEETPVDMFSEHYKINLLGTVVMYQAFLSLLRNSDDAKFIPITSAAASLTQYVELQAGYAAYGASKIAVNYVSRKIHFENEWLTCFPLSPGIIWTELALKNREMDKTGKLAPIQDAVAVTPEVGAVMLLKVIHEAKRETHGGEFINLDGERISW